MFLELAEHLRCPSDHAEAHLVVATGAMHDRAIVFGTIGCPVCTSEYMIVNRVAHFGEPPAPAPASGAAPPDPEAVQALLGLESPGGFVVLLGEAARLAEPLSTLMDDVHFVGINAPDDVAAAGYASLLTGASSIPLRAAMARGVVVGADLARGPWLGDAVRVLLRGQRLLVLAEIAAPGGIEVMAAGEGMFVGQKTA